MLYYGDNLEILRNRIAPESVDLCYIDPPFNSKRNYNQIYNNVGAEDRAQAQAFVDTWEWDDRAIEGFSQIIENAQGRFPSQTVELIKGLHKVLGQGGLLAYLVSMTLRLVEIHRVLKPTGSFFLHCDPTASHYLKLILDGVFCSQGGEFRNEIIWHYKSGGRADTFFSQKHDVLLWYTKSASEWTFNKDDIGVPRNICQDCGSTLEKWNNLKKMVDSDGRTYRTIKSSGKIYKYYDDEPVIPDDVWLGINHLQQKDPERLGYPTQKPEALLERIIQACSKEGDVVLDAYCGCGTTIAVAARLNRQWIGIDITYQSIALVMERMEKRIGKVAWLDYEKTIHLDGIPRDLQSAVALAHKKDDRVRKEFEKWAVLTYTNNRAIIHEKKGADSGIDGIVYFMSSPDNSDVMVFQVKSGGVGRGDIAKLRGDMDRVGAAMATLITLEEPTAPMIAEAKAAGHYHHSLMGRDYDKIQVVQVQDIIEKGARLEMPLTKDVLKKARVAAKKTETMTLPWVDASPKRKSK